MEGYKAFAKECLEDTIGAVVRTGLFFADTARGENPAGEALREDAEMAGGLVFALLYGPPHMIPGMLVPSQLREKWYACEDWVFEKTGLYTEERKDFVDNVRNISAGALEFFPGLLAIVPTFDLVVRMDTLDSRIYCDPESLWVENTSEKYLPAMMPIELAYVGIMKPLRHVKKLYDKHIGNRRQDGYDGS